MNSNPTQRLTRPVARGFTLIELLVTLAVLVIIITVGVPGFQNLTNQNRAAGTANELLTALQAARSAAVTRSRDIEICASDTTGAEDPDNISCSNSSDWSTGWVVRDPGVGETLRVRGPVRGGVAIRGPDGPVTFTNAGVVEGSTSLSRYDFDVDVNSGRAERCVDFGIGGRAEVLEGDC